MGKRQRSRESSWGEFHAIQKVLDAAPEAGGQGTFGWEGRFVHSRCNITSRLKTRQNTSWVYGRQWEYERGLGRHFGQGQTSKGSTDQDTRFCAGIRNEPETLLTNFWRTTLATLPTSSASPPLHNVAQPRSDSPVLPLDSRNFEIEKVDIMPSPLPFLLTLCVVLVCVWLWWRSNKQ